MQVFTFFLKVGVPLDIPRDCTVGTSLGGTTRGILGGFPGRVLSGKVLINNAYRGITTQIWQFPLFLANFSKLYINTLFFYKHSL